MALHSPCCISLYSSGDFHIAICRGDRSYVERNTIPGFCYGVSVGICGDCSVDWANLGCLCKVQERGMEIYGRFE